VAKRANPPKSKLFGVVACLKTDIVEFSHPLGQCSQARCSFRFSPLVINKRREQMHVLPLEESVHINKKPLSESTFPVALKVASRYSFQRWRCSDNPIPEKTVLSYQAG
jgi:hypothetical protein